MTPSETDLLMEEVARQRHIISILADRNIQLEKLLAQYGYEEGDKIELVSGSQNPPSEMNTVLSYLINSEGDQSSSLSQSENGVHSGDGGLSASNNG